MKDNIILVNSCDAYEDVWELFFCAFQEYWPECKYRVILNTENKKFTSTKVDLHTHNFNSPDGRDMWGLRLKQTLIECQSKYVVMLYDDFVLEGNVDQDQIVKCAKWLDENPEVAVFYFINNPANKNIDDRRFDNFELIPTKGDFKLNSAPAIWRRKKLLEFIDDNDTPWAWEFFGSYRTYSSTDLFYCVQREHEDIYPYNYITGGAIYRGKWVRRIVVPLINKYNLRIDLNDRGLTDGVMKKDKRTLLWKINFFLLGFKMIKFGIILFIYRILIKKFLT